LGLGAAGLLGGGVAGVRRWRSRFRLRSRSTAELLADAARDPIRPLWQEVFDFGTVGFVYSPAGMGKTDFLLAAVAASIKAAVQGEPVVFCGRLMHGARWLVVSEQTSASVESYLRAWGLHLGDALPYVRWITWEQARTTWRRSARWQRLPKDEQLMPPWNWTAEMLQREANDQGCTAVLLDTYKQWAADTSASENDTGGVRKAVVPLQALAEDGKRKAVLVSAHSSASLKLAGSETLKGLVGALTGMHKPDAKRWPTVRELVMDKNRNRRAPDKIRVVRTEHPDGTCEYHEWVSGATKGVVRPGKTPEPAALDAGGVGGERLGGTERTNGALPETNRLVVRLEANGADGVSTAVLTKELGWDRAKVKRELDKLKAVGKAEPTGEKDGRAVVWRAKSDGAVAADR
jgi:biotin operon repressor